MLLAACSLLREEELRPPPDPTLKSIIEDRLPKELQRGEFIPVLPQAVLSESWNQAGGSPTRVGVNLQLNSDLANLKVKRTASGGKGGGDDFLFTSGAVIAEAKVFVIDSTSKVSAFEAKTLKKLWSTDISFSQGSEEGPALTSGAVASDYGKVFATNGKRSAVALDSQTGELIWKRKFTFPLRGSPTLVNNRVLLKATDNRLFVLDSQTGELLWRHVGLEETINFAGITAASSDGNAVMVAYSSGELFVLASENGFELWRSDLMPPDSQLLASSLPFDAVAPPVVVNERVYVTTRGFETIAFSLLDGTVLWNVPVQSSQTPWVAGNSVFVATLEGELICLNSKNGKFLWRRKLPAPEDEKVFWNGPLVLNGAVMVVSTEGSVRFYSADTGKPLGAGEAGDGETGDASNGDSQASDSQASDSQSSDSKAGDAPNGDSSNNQIGLELGERIPVAPSVADGVIYFFSEDAELIAVE